MNEKSVQRIYYCGVAMILAVLASKTFFLIKLTWHFRCKLINSCGQCHNSGG